MRALISPIYSLILCIGIVVWVSFVCAYNYLFLLISFSLPLSRFNFLLSPLCLCSSHLVGFGGGRYRWRVRVPKRSKARTFTWRAFRAATRRRNSSVCSPRAEPSSPLASSPTGTPVLPPACRLCCYFCCSASLHPIFSSLHSVASPPLSSLSFSFSLSTFSTLSSLDTFSGSSLYTPQYYTFPRSPPPRVLSSLLFSCARASRNYIRHRANCELNRVESRRVPSEA